VSGPLARDELAELIAGGENSFVEFKDARTSGRNLAKEMCAFANASGGRILIGVDDEDGALHDAGEWTEERVMTVARTSLDPPLIPTYQSVTLEGSQIAVIGVDRGAEKPYAVANGEGRRYYVRVGSTSREPSREELVRLTQASGAVASDLRPVLGASMEDLDDGLVAARFADRRTLDFTELEPTDRRRVLVEAELLHRETHCPTIGGMLCFGREPQAHLPYAELDCVAYAGDSVARDIVDQVKAGGRADEQIRVAVEFAQRNIAHASTVKGVERVAAPRPSEESLREVVANAVAHRHYGIQGPTHLRVFSDRLEVLNPGEPPNGVTPNGMRIGVSVRRNQFIVQFLVERGLMDAVGRGVVLLYEEAATLGLAPPRIEPGDHLTSFTLALR